MVRWVVCGFAAGLACTISNPTFVLDGDGSTATSDGPPATASTTSPDPASAAGDTAAASEDPAPDTTTDGEVGGAGDDTDDRTTTTSLTTTAGDDTTTGGDPPDTSGDTSTGEPAPCTDVCGSPGCGQCPEGDVVAFPGFEMDSREVSNGQYQQFLAANPDPASQPGSCAWNDSFTPSKWPVADATLPVVNVDWCDARAYCAWTGKRLCGAITGGPTELTKLVDPTVDQWYRACSNGDYRPYPYGKLYNAGACNGAGALLGKLLGVGTLATCEAPVDGAFDLSGNVWEWVDTCYGDGPDSQCLRRGGSYYSDLGDLRCDTVGDDPRDTAIHYVGLRCCSL